MSSNFGGDGGDVLVDPANGCNIVQEYVVPGDADDADLRASRHDRTRSSTCRKSTTISIAPPDINARFIAPFAATRTNKNQWLAGGNSVWYQDKGFAIRSRRRWTNV